jgi:uncharacterized protein with HEPN domain
MFKSTKNDLVYFMLLLKSIAKLKYYTQDLVTFEDFAEANEEMNFDASLAQFTQIGELINKISIETKSKYHGIPWNAIEIKLFMNTLV